MGVKAGRQAGQKRLILFEKKPDKRIRTRVDFTSDGGHATIKSAAS